MGEAAKMGEITEKHFDTVFGLNTRGTLFTVQKALSLFNDGGSIFMTVRLLQSKAGLTGECIRRARLRCAHSPARGSTN